MTSRIANVCIDAVDPELVAGFWCAVLGWEVLERDDSVVCLGPDDGAPGASSHIDVLRVPDAKGGKNRLHLDLRADGTTTAAELERLLGLGARRVDVGQGPDATWVVLADPEGNEFCLLSRAVQEL